MPTYTRRGRIVRWGVPIAAVAVVAGAVTAGPVIAAVQGDPVLPERSAGQLLAEAVRAGQSGDVPPMSGTVVETASLGIPGLPEVTGDTGSPAALLAGSHEARVWYGDAGRVRVALPGRMSETNLIVNGDQAWLWESAGNRATRIKLPEGHAGARPTPLPSVVTPQEAATRMLAGAEEHSAVSVTNTERVANRPSYQLVLTPKDDRSLVSEIKLALDGETFVPLRFQVYAKGSLEPAFEVGYTSVTFSPPAPENFTFTPPAGAKVEEQTLGADAKRVPGGLTEEGRGEVRTVGSGWTTVVVLPAPDADTLRRQASQAQAPSSAPSSDPSPGQGEAGQAGQGEAGAGQLVAAVLDSAERVQGEWGSGRLLRTKLVTALLTDDGRLLAGAVRPEVLYEAAGRK
ncbi:membrane protein [Microtetraspora sp. NBRC 13810]|uniref:LolA family protein n=1 Tax=Microtetraspora sp. NBRC 13810 TaxID=3030990 RepID=UPI0024A54C8E|nr:DUF2092 domain-containing protein [Microtetraspora sp. NBRC 13810]GLW09320.1 membrane protein [Microtetraspora sp. NBRC 13810]